ncbi:GTP cyclohydrolase (plasmid) [Legionella adelaidensis]|uniref:NADPH-dependent 7-cyano-7-deazaguanine reductase n=2 Tax=Legionella adelaidensis TaxID=45056 RepID=A0A0W0R4N7_9GAMM|nr:NADPH-dependent 7-cyano-7-deazaguanine reductase QueF [Legionella adelaidensis]KTC66024.1 GTP cyclohydrolase [Legionella adelaidensis]VEH85761.1 GTP cyclohydrolase [Legionella adelaidensis]
MKYYKIKDISRVTALSVRSLQYYDDIGLLKPSLRTDAGYRLYSERDLIRLQQVVTLKFLGFSLTAIRKILEGPEFEVLNSMHIQAEALKEKAAHINEAARLTTYIASQLEAGEHVNWHSALQIVNILESNRMSEALEKRYQMKPEQSELGKSSNYDSQYNPERLFAIPREAKRKEIGVNPENLPFYGFDCWNHYEVSWLNAKGKPVVAIAEIIYDCSTPNLIESKSLKLYFNSFNNTHFKDSEELKLTVERDLSSRLGGEAHVRILSLKDEELATLQAAPSGECIDDLDVTCSIYLVEPAYLSVEDKKVEEILYSDLLKSNCLVTNQPDWGSVQIAYTGQKINREGLLKYLVSFRNHNEFHEQCIERIFVDIMNRCKPEKLTVYGRYTRRGGLDINPYRTTEKVNMQGLNYRLVRQ